MATNEERRKQMELAGMPLLADHYAKLSNRENSSSPSQRKGGLGSSKGAAKYANTSAEDRRKANTDGRYGYFDEVNKRYVPAFIDAMDGGGFDTRGDTFKGGIFSDMLNDLGVKPYGSQMERAFVSPSTSPDVQAGFGSIPRPRKRPEPPMQFGDQPAGSMPSMSFGQQPVGSMPAANMQFGDQPAGSMPSMSFGQQPAGSLPSMSFGQQPAGSMPSMSFGQQPAGSMPSMSFGQQPAGSMPERRKRQIVPNPDYAVSVPALIDYLQSNKGFMGVDNAIDDYETMLLTGRYPRA